MLRGTWTLGDVRDVEGFCGDVIAKFTRGERAAHKPGSDAFLSASDKEDLLAYLLAVSWQAWLKFNPVDDGRGTNRFSGFLVWTLHRRLVDWLRLTKGSTRYPTNRIVTELVEYRPELHDRPHWDAEYDDGDALDLDAAPDGTREALELLRPWLDGEVRSAKEIGPGAESALTLVRGEARRQGLEPDGEERQALADRVRDLRERGMHYKEIAAELGLGHASTARSLLQEYHPELIQKSRSVEAASV